VAVAAAFLAGDAAADAATTYRGKTSQGHRAGVRIGAGDLAERVRIRWIARCGRSNARFRETTLVVGPLRGSTATAFAGGGTYRVRVGRRMYARVSVRLRGSRVDDHRWKGTFTARAVIVLRGRRFDRCRLGTVRWWAAVPRVSLDMTSDNGDYIGAGGSYSYRSPQDGGRASGNRRLVEAAVGPWTLSFQAPTGRTLAPGRFTGATRYPFNEAAAGLDVSGDGRGCNDLTGEFTVHSSSFTRKGKLRSIDVSFEQHCEGGIPALRGRLSFAPG
jgi:hypothetical protein